MSTEQNTHTRNATIETRLVKADLQLNKLNLDTRRCRTPDSSTKLDLRTQAALIIRRPGMAAAAASGTEPTSAGTVLALAGDVDVPGGSIGRFLSAACGPKAANAARLALRKTVASFARPPTSKYAS